jgi:aldose sugar dehydrogenase
MAQPRAECTHLCAGGSYPRATFRRMSTKRVVLGGTLFAAASIAVAAAIFRGPAPTSTEVASADPRSANAPTQRPAFTGQTDAPLRKSDVAFEVVTVAKGLESPWGLAFLPDGRMLVTEQPGRLRLVSPDGLVLPVAGLSSNIAAIGQGGLLDVALDPEFASNRRIYWSFSEQRPNGTNNTAVARGTVAGDAMPRVEQVEIIYHQQPSLPSRAHFGGRLVFAGDGTLFITQGERSITEGRMQAQRLDGLLGKIVRINRDGTVQNDNPFVGRTGARPEIWSLGHRNVEAATLHPLTGELWEVEHGTRGGDEINIARKGRDYGWPTIAYGIEYAGSPITGGIQVKEGMEQPLYYWDPVIAPSGMTFYTGNLFPAWKNNLFIGGLASQALVRLTIDGERVVDEERLLSDMRPRERIRDVVQGPEGALYLLTDDTEGRVLKLIPKS